MKIIKNKLIIDPFPVEGTYDDLKIQISYGSFYFSNEKGHKKLEVSAEEVIGMIEKNPEFEKLIDEIKKDNGADENEPQLNAILGMGIDEDD